MNTSHPASILAAILGVTITVTAHAQSGRPSEAPPACPTVVAVDVDDVGSYARYLMLNGMPQDEAVKAARNIDHPAPPRRLAMRRAAARPDAGSRSVGSRPAAGSQQDEPRADAARRADGNPVPRY